MGIIEGSMSTPDVTGVSAEIAANIERYLRNHTREGGHAWQMNMAARPSHWQPLPTTETNLPSQPVMPGTSPTVNPLGLSRSDSPLQS